MGGFSRKGLIEQLRFEDFSKAEAMFAVNYIDPNWNNAGRAVRAELPRRGRFLAHGAD